MRARVGAAVRRVIRASTWPLRFIERPRSPHRDQQVTIFVGADRYDFAPARLGARHGHVHHGHLRPDAADLAARLERLQMSPAPAQALAIISGFEGGFDAVQTYDRGLFSWGFIQFTATGGLPRLLTEIQAHDRALFDECFGEAGIGVEQLRITVRVGTRTYRGPAATRRLHDEPSLWMPFLHASRLSAIKDRQVKSAVDNYYTAPLRWVVPIGTERVALAELFADHAYARAVICDRSINRGLGHTLAVVRRAVARVKPRTTADASQVLDAIVAQEQAYLPRLRSLEQQLRDATTVTAREG